MDADGGEPEREVVQPLAEEEMGPRLAAFNLIFKEHSSQMLREGSRKERKEKEMDEQQTRNLSYSEVGIENLNMLLNKIKETPGQYGSFFKGEGVFLDLGSGAGKACIGASLLHPFKKIVGVECLDALSDAAGAAQGKLGNPDLLATLENPLPEDVKVLFESMVKPEIEFIKGNFVDEFDDKLAPLAPDLSIVLAVATTFGEQQLQAMRKLADLMPEGSLFITITQRFPDSLILDLDRDPMQRMSDATKRALKKRGMDPTGVEFWMAPAPNDPKAWRQVCEQQIDLEWGTSKAYIFRKLPSPHCYVGDLCMAAPAPKKVEGEKKEEDGGEKKKEKVKEEDLEYFLSIYREPQTVIDEEGAPKLVKFAILLDDPFEEQVEMHRSEPMTKQRWELYKKQYAKAFDAVKGYVHADATHEAETSLQPVLSQFDSDGTTLRYSTVDTPPPESKIVPSPEVTMLGEKLLCHVEAIAKEPWAAKFMLNEFAQVCREQDTEGIGSIPAASVPIAWKAMKAKLVGVLEERLNKVNNYQFP